MFCCKARAIPGIFGLPNLHFVLIHVFCIYCFWFPGCSVVALYIAGRYNQTVNRVFDFGYNRKLLYRVSSCRV
jgi:hypothetical protein